MPARRRGCSLRSLQSLRCQRALPAPLVHPRDEIPKGKTTGQPRQRLPPRAADFIDALGHASYVMLGLPSLVRLQRFQGRCNSSSCSAMSSIFPCRWRLRAPAPWGPGPCGDSMAVLRQLGSSRPFLSLKVRLVQSLLDVKRVLVFRGRSPRLWQRAGVLQGNLPRTIHLGERN